MKNHSTNNNGVIIASTALFEYLKGSQTRQLSRNSATRIEAFCDILAAQSQTVDIGQQAYKPFCSSIQTYSERWKWNRITVRTFLHQLENLGIIEMKADNKGINIQIQNLIGMLIEKPT